MSIAAPPSGNFAVPPFPVRRLSVQEYHLMIEAGILTEDDAVELLDGWVVAKMPRSSQHDLTVDHDHDVLRTHLPAGWRVRAQCAITTPDSEPEPDFAVVPGPASRYRTGHPGPADVALVAEVSDSTLGRDRGEKWQLYARAGIPCYWIINLVDRCVEDHEDPDSQAGYRLRHDYFPGELVPLVLAGREVARIPAVDLLP